MEIVIDRNTLNGLDMHLLPTYRHLSRTTLSQQPDGSMLESLSLEWNNNFLQTAGRQHYRLLAYIASLFNNVQIGDIGTSSGGSAMALASNQRNVVYSLDRVNCRTKDFSEVKNVEFVVGSFYDDEIFSKILKSTVILLDIQHEGPDEKYFYNRLTASRWNGLLICDDITLNSEMRKFWSEITHPKFDVTEYGHGDNGSGTGVVAFGEYNIVLR